MKGTNVCETGVRLTDFMNKGRTGARSLWKTEHFNDYNHLSWTGVPREFQGRVSVKNNQTYAPVMEIIEI